MQKVVYSLVLALVLSSCVKDKPNQPQPQGAVQLSNSKKVFVVNEGPFTPGESGSVSLYDPGTNEVIEDFYKVQNTAATGNITQSMNYFRGNYYIVVNNAGKILVCDQQLKKQGEISGLTSPRYIQEISGKKAYVSDLYANAISIVDLNTNTKTGSIPCHGKTERMALLYNKLFVTNTDKDYLYIINTLTDQVSDSVNVGPGAASVVLDKTDHVWVLASGVASSKAGRLSCINALNNQVEFSYEFKLSDFPGYLCLNKTKDTLFFVNRNIYRVAIQDKVVPAAAFIEAGSRNFYGIGVNPNDHTIYAADALDYMQRSQIYIYKADGSLKHSFKAGMISNGFYFE